jgi:hypothetical protein
VTTKAEKSRQNAAGHEWRSLAENKTLRFSFFAFMIICAFLPGISGCEKNANRNGPPVIFVIDTFDGRDSHGENVSQTLAKSCYRTCEIKNISLGSAVRRDPYLDALEDILRFARENPDRHILINMSFGSTEPDSQERRLIETMVRRGMLLVAAAGNNDTDKPMYPAAYPGVLAVAAVDLYGKKEAYSNYGRYIAVAAGGFLKTQIVSRELKGAGPYSREYVRYLITGGTSFAAPRVSGLAGLVWSREPGLTAAEIAETIRKSATPLPDNAYYLRGDLGSGLVNEYQSLYRVDERFRRLVKWFYLAWLPYLAIWLAISFRSWRRRDLFGPFIEGLFIAVFVLVSQFYAVWIWGEIQGRLAGMLIWLIVGLLGLAVYIRRKREEAFVRAYRFEPEVFDELSEVSTDSTIRRIYRQKLREYLIRRNEIRPDLADRILTLNFGEREMIIIQISPV